METMENLARALPFQCWLLVISGWETGWEMVCGRAGGSGHFWQVPCVTNLCLFAYAVVNGSVTGCIRRSSAEMYF